MTTNCPYPDTTQIKKVMVAKGYCEYGEDCVWECAYSYSKDERMKAVIAFMKYPYRLYKK